MKGLNGPALATRRLGDSATRRLGDDGKLGALFVFFETILEENTMGFGLSAEVEHEADLVLCCGEVAKELSGGARMELLGRLDFNNDFVVDDHVEYLPHERLSAKVHHHGNLARYVMAFRH
jgi:hypothetical protein